MYTAKTPHIVKALYHDLEWKISTPGRDLFITFDDGPIPEVTPEVLKILHQFRAKATFFCIGDNVRKHPDVFQEVKQNGHAIGNHTYHHLNGWKTPLREYLRNTLQCDELVRSKLFRPPYGRITRQQARVLRSRYRIIMWDVLSADFDQSISYDRCLQNVLNHAEAGSVVVFHDSLKAADRMLYALPRVLEHFSEKGFSFRSLM